MVQSPGGDTCAEKSTMPRENGRHSFRVRLYLFWLRLFRGAVNLIQAATTGFWLGVFNHADYAEVDTAYYNRQRMYQDDAYNSGGLSWWEREAIDRYFGNCRRLLVTAAGGGREVLALRRLGFDVEAIECNQSLAAYANRLLGQEGYPASVRVCQRDTVLSDVEGAYDGIIVGWGSFMLVPAKHRRVKLLRELRTLIPEGAPVLLSFFARESAHRRLAIIQRVGTVLRRVQGQEPLEYGDDLSPNYVHHFDREEIESSLRDAGFELVAYDTRDYGHAVALALPLAGVPSNLTANQRQGIRQTSDVA
jgi:hypothetical protein